MTRITGWHGALWLQTTDTAGEMDKFSQCDVAGPRRAPFRAVQLAVSPQGMPVEKAVDHRPPAPVLQSRESLS